MKNNITIDKIKIETKKCRSDIAYFAKKKYLRIRLKDGRSVNLSENIIKRLNYIEKEKRKSITNK